MDKQSHYRDRVKFTRKMKKTHTILSPSMAPIHFKILKPILLRQGFKIEIMDAEGPEVLQLALKYLHNDMCYPSMLTTGQMLATVMSGKYDPDKSSNYLINGRQLVSLSKKDDGHWGRVEISLSGEKDSTFMNVIYVTDKGQTKDAPAIEHIEANGVEGSTFGDVSAVFMTSRERVSSAVSFSVKGSGDMKYYVSGVAAGKWSVSVGGKDYGTVTATEEGGFLNFTAPAGSVTLTPAK